jgi:hypothetical protein
LTFVAAALSCVVALPARAQEQPELKKPVLVGKGTKHFVHALKMSPLRAEGLVEFVVAPGWGLVYTNRESGQMHPTGTVRINTRRISYSQSRIVGVAADADRLYVLRWQSGRVFDKPPDAKPEGGRYELSVFWLADGSLIQLRPLETKGLPKHAPVEQLTPGPLKLVKGGVSCYGSTFRYKGKKPA